MRRRFSVQRFGLDDDKRVEKILGREYAAVYFNECSEIAFPSIEIALTRLAQKRFDANGKRLRNRAFFDCNPPGKSHWSYRLFVEGVHPISRKPLPNADEYGAIQINPADNLENLPDGYVESTLGAASERTRKRFLLGEFSDDVENALWKSATAATARLRERVRAFSFDSLRRRLPFRRGKIGTGGRCTGSFSTKR